MVEMLCTRLSTSVGVDDPFYGVIGDPVTVLHHLSIIPVFQVAKMGIQVVNPLRLHPGTSYFTSKGRSYLYVR
jgi:hypothetical protein